MLRVDGDLVEWGEIAKFAGVMVTPSAGSGWLDAGEGAGRPRLPHSRSFKRESGENPEQYPLL